MKNFFRLLFFCLIATVGLTAFHLKADVTKNLLPAQPNSAVMVLEQVDQVTGVTQEIIRLDTAQNAQCDTCYSNYISAIRENREMSKKLSDKNLELYDKYQKAVQLEKSVDSLNRVLETEKKRIVDTLKRIAKKGNKSA